MPHHPQTHKGGDIPELKIDIFRKEQDIVGGGIHLNLPTQTIVAIDQ